MAEQQNPLVKIYADWVYYQDFPISRVPQHLQASVTSLLATYPTDPYIEEHRHLISHVDGLQNNLNLIDTNLGKKVDKVTGKGLSTNDYTTAEKTKLEGVSTGANNYVHPANHPATIITQTATHRFVSDTEKANWNGKETVTGSQNKADVALSSAKTYTDTKVAGIVDTAPEALDTLNELAAALGDDPNFATTVATQIGTKVDKVVGKGLSTNDYTTAEKNKLAGLQNFSGSYEDLTNKPSADEIGGGFAGSVGETLDHLDEAIRNHSNVVEIHRKITFGTAAPSGGTNGDVYFRYE